MPFFGKVYLGPYMAAKQGDVKRHYFMQKMIENEARKGSRKKSECWQEGLFKNYTIL